MRNYANAADVLPPKLLAEVRKHWLGCLWIPSENENGSVKRVLDTIKSGRHTVAEVAALSGASVPSVYRIARKLGDTNPFKQQRRCHAMEDNSIPATV